MLILMPSGVVIGGDTDMVAELGDFGRLMKSSSFRMKPWLGDISSWSGDFSSCDEDDERSDDGFLRITSRWRSIEPGSVRGGTLFCGSGPG